MEIHHLRYFVAVAEELSFSRAAERLHMATSPLSRRIRDLERELGAALFVRGYHQVSLTDVGRRILPVATEVVDKFDTLRSTALEAVQPTVRSATVGMAPEVSPWLRTTFIEWVNATLPWVRVKHEPASTAPLVRAVVRGEVDLAFVHGRVTDPDLVAVRVEDQRVAVVVGRGIGFDNRTSIGMHELAHLPYVSLREAAAPFIYRFTDELLTRHGVHGRIATPSNNQADLVPPVAAGQAFTICGCDFGATRKAFADEPVVMLPFDDGNVRLVTYAVWRADRLAHSPTLRELTSMVCDRLAACSRVV